jgi:GTP-binding protein HflX
VADHRELLLSDTVGFIDRLPHALVAAFRATLEEVAEADLLLHVVDAASPGPDRRMAAVRRVLEEVGASDVPVLEVMNKCDRLEESERRRIEQASPDAWLASAVTGEGCVELLDAIASRLALDTCRVTLQFDPDREADRQRIGQLYRHAKVIGHVARHGSVSIEADVPRRLLDRFTGRGQEEAT